MDLEYKNNFFLKKKSKMNFSSNCKGIRCNIYLFPYVIFRICTGYPLSFILNKYSISKKIYKNIYTSQTF